jgi:integrase
MPLYKRPGSPYWWTRFTVGGRRIRCSTETTSRTEAATFERRLREREWGRAHAGDRSWQEACKRWLEDHPAKRSLDRDQSIIEWTLANGADGQPRLKDWLLHEINQDRLDELRKEKAAETSPATANRYLALLRAILNAAVGWDWLAKAPKAPMFRLQPAAPQWLTPAEFTALLDHLPPHTRQLARFAVATGLRRSNITGLRWSQVNLQRRHLQIHAEDAKGRRSIPVPLTPSALEILREQRDHPKRHATWVFPYRGRPVYQVATQAWRDAVKAIGRPGLRFHDLRHTWASWHVQAGTPLPALQALGGWADLQLVTRYAHLDSRSLRQYAKAVSVPGHKSGTPKKKPPRKAA